MNPNQSHFSRIRASGADSGRCQRLETMNRPDALIPPLGACMVLYIGTPHARVAPRPFDPSIDAIDPSRSAASTDRPELAMFFNRCAIDTEYGGLAFEEEAGAAASNYQTPPSKY